MSASPKFEAFYQAINLVQTAGSQLVRNLESGGDVEANLRLVKQSLNDANTALDKFEACFKDKAQPEGACAGCVRGLRAVCVGCAAAPAVVRKPRPCSHAPSRRRRRR